MPWTVQVLNAAVAQEIAALPADMRARLARLINLIEQIGFEALPRDSVKHLDDKLWELRITGRDGISRADLCHGDCTTHGHPARLHQEDPEDADEGARNCPSKGEGGEMIRFKELYKKWMKDPEYRKEYEALEEEFALAAAVAKARIHAGLSQAELARRMKTTQSTIARLESGRGRPSTRTLDRFARATGHRLKITFEPVTGRKGIR
jgi:ribosome-binding protein aMBF1 (putative translation factor)